MLVFVMKASRKVKAPAPRRFGVPESVQRDLVHAHSSPIGGQRGAALASAASCCKTACASPDL